MRGWWLQVVQLPRSELGNAGAACIYSVSVNVCSLLHMCLQVLKLARCELHDAGGAVILTALRSHPCLRELDLSWNALSHGTAKAVEAAFRRV
jgi:hypothetical protein